MLDKLMTSTEIENMNQLLRKNSADDFIYEACYSGYRVLAHIEKDKVIFESGSSEKISRKFSKIEKELLSLKLEDSTLEGIIIALNEEGVSDLMELNLYKSSSKRYNLKFVALDMTRFHGKNIMHLAITERKSILEDYINEELFDNNRDSLLENKVLYIPEKLSYDKNLKSRLISRKIIAFSAKRKNAEYDPMNDKNSFTILSHPIRSFIICGFTLKSEEEGVNTLLLGEYRQGKLISKGFSKAIENEEMARELYKKLKKITKSTHPFTKSSEADEIDAIFAKPTLVASFLIEETSSVSNIKKAYFRGLRPDVSPKKIVSKKKNPLRESTRIKNNDSVSGVRLTGLNNVIYPRKNITKKEIIDYYSLISERMLQYSLNQVPKIYRYLNFERVNVPFKRKLSNFPSMLRVLEADGVEIRQNLDSKDLTVLSVTGTLLHRSSVREAISLLHTFFKESGIKADLKTNGYNGYDIFLKINNNKRYDKNSLTEVINKFLEKDKSLKKLREKINWSFDGKDIILPYSIYANDSISISCPILFEEVANISPDQITVENIVEKLLKEDNPWK